MIDSLLAGNDQNRHVTVSNQLVYKYCILQIIPWIGISYQSVLNLIAFTVLTTVALYCYLLSVLMDPGAVPREYEHDFEDVTAMYIQVLFGMRNILCEWSHLVWSPGWTISVTLYRSRKREEQ